MKEGMFVFVSHKPQHLFLCSWYHWKALDEQGCIKLMSYGFNVWWRSYSILNNFLNENSFKSKLKFTRDFGNTFGIIGKPSMSGI
jgi:hypothetical protein